MAEYRKPISTLPEYPNTKEARALRRDMLPLLRKVIKAIVIDRPLSENMLAEVYFAGIWHGSEIVRQQGLPLPPKPRERDVIDVSPRRRRKASA